MEKILIVDDDQAMRRMISLTLAAKGYNVIEADSSVTGLEMARRHLPDLILCDVFMPGGDGYILLQAIRLDPTLNSRRVVFMSGMHNQLPEPKNSKDRPDDYIPKPFTLQVLLNCLDARSFAVGSRFIELITAMALAITGYIVSGIRFKSSNLTQQLEALHSRHFPNWRWRASEVVSGVAYSYRTRRNIFRG
jgi:CheY-like chemotaxis protein